MQQVHGCLLEERHGNGQHQLWPVAPSEDGSPWVLHALQRLIGQHNGVKLNVHVLCTSHFLENTLGL